MSEKVEEALQLRQEEFLLLRERPSEVLFLRRFDEVAWRNAKEAAFAPEHQRHYRHIVPVEWSTTPFTDNSPHDSRVMDYTQPTDFVLGTLHIKGKAAPVILIREPGTRGHKMVVDLIEQLAENFGVFLDLGVFFLPSGGGTLTIQSDPPQIILSSFSTNYGKFDIEAATAVFIDWQTRHLEYARYELRAE